MAGSGCPGRGQCPEPKDRQPWCRSVSCPHIVAQPDPHDPYGVGRRRHGHGPVISQRFATRWGDAGRAVARVQHAQVFLGGAATAAKPASVPPDRVHPVAAAHTVAATQYTPANGVTAVVLAASALRGIDGMGHSCRSAP